MSILNTLVKRLRCIVRNYFMSCPLCSARIAEQYRVVCENAHVFVLVNREPVKDGHVLTLPVRHVG